MKVLKLLDTSDKFIKYVSIGYAVFHILTTGLGALNPHSLFSNTVYQPLIGNHFDAWLWIYPVLGVVFGLQRIARRILSNVKHTINQAVILLLLVIGLLIVWFVFIMPVGA